MASPARIAVVADADAYFQLAISGLLTRKLDFAEVIEAYSFDEAKEYVKGRADVSIAIVNLSIPGMDGAAGLRAFRERFLETKIAVTSVSSSRRNILAALDSGVHGYIPKDLSIADLTVALRLVLDGGIFVPPSLAELDSSSGANAQIQLTPRQRDVLELLVQGKPNKEIASTLKLSEGTVKIHLAAIFRLFGVNNRAAAVVACARPNPGRVFPVLMHSPQDGISINAN